MKAPRLLAASLIAAIAGALAGTGTGTGTAQAGPSQYFLSDPNVFADGFADVTLTDGAWSKNMQAGQITVVARNLATNVTSSMQVYCTDIFDPFSNGIYTLGTFGSTVASQATIMGIGALIANGNPLVSTSTSSAALQIAIWDVLYDGFPVDADVTTGTFHVSRTPKSVVNAADADLENLIDGAWKLPANETVDQWLPADCSPDLSFVTATSVPEPASAALLGVGLASIASLTALRRRQAVSAVS